MVYPHTHNSIGMSNCMDRNKLQSVCLRKSQHLKRLMSKNIQKGASCWYTHFFSNGSYCIYGVSVGRFWGSLANYQLFPYHIFIKQLAALAAELSHKLGQSGASLAYRDFSHAVAVDGRNKGIRLLSHKIPFKIPGLCIIPVLLRALPMLVGEEISRQFGAKNTHRSQGVDSLELN